MIRIFTDTFRNLITSSALILKTEAEENRLSSLTGDNLDSEVRRGVGNDNAVAYTTQIMDSALQPNMLQPNYTVDVVLPTLLIALLLVGNAAIVYVIYQYRKRKTPSGGTHPEEVALDAASGVPPV